MQNPWGGHELGFVQRIEGIQGSWRALWGAGLGGVLWEADRES